VVATAAAACVVVGTAVAPAGGQTDPNVTTTTVRTTTTTVCDEPQPQFPFVGVVLERDGDVVTFGVLAAPPGSPVPAEVPVLFPDQGRYLDEGGRYAVVAIGPDPAVEVDDGSDDDAEAADPSVTTVAPALPALLQGRVKLAEGECGALTVHEDGSTVDTAVLKPLFDNWRRLAWSVIVPVLAVVALLGLLVAAKRFVTRLAFGPMGPRSTPGQRAPRPEPPPGR